MLNEKRSEKLTDEEETDVDDCIRQATNRRGSCSQHSQNRIRERIAEQIAARTCRKEQTVEAMKMIPQERVSKRIVKQIMDKSVPQVAGAERQGFSKPRNKLRTRRHNLQCLKTGSSSEPLNKLWSCEDACPANREHS